MKTNFRNLVRITVLVFTIFAVACGPVAPLTSATPTAIPVATLPAAVVRQAQAASGPQIVAQTPLKGERLALQPVIRLAFDRDMDPASTAAAWTFLGPDGKPLPGQVTWPDKRTFQFKPAASLKSSTDYTGVFSTKAGAADGAPVGAELRLGFRSLDALALGQVFPADKTENVDVGTTVTLIFNRPVVPVDIVEEQDKLPQPVKFTPDVAGHGEWVNSSVYVFKPEQLLHSGTAYQVKVAAGLKDTTGDALAEDYAWNFTTRAPEIAHFSLVGGEQDPRSEIGMVLLDQAFIVDFVQPMDAASVAKALTLVNRETKQPFPYKMSWNKDFTELTIQPVGRYAVGGFYDLDLATAAQAQGGGTLKDGLAFKFATVPFPAIENVSPMPGSSGGAFVSLLWVQFASPMNFASLKGKIKITPALAKDGNWYYDTYQRKLNIDGLAPDTQYVVRVLPGTADIYGNTIKTEYSFTFKTGSPSPSASLLTQDPMIYRVGAPQDIFFNYTNLKAVTFSLYRLSFDEFSGLLYNDLDKLLASKPAANLVREWQPDGLQVSSNKDIMARIPLRDDLGKPLPPGYYFLGVKAPELGSNLAFYQGTLLVVATDNITLKTTPNEALAWVVDLQKGQPVPGVKVGVYDQKHVFLGNANTDKDGLVYLPGLTSQPYLVQLDDSQHVAVASTDWGSGVSPADFGLWQTYYNGATTSAPFAYVYTERPLYRPGQDVYFKGIVRQNDDLHYTLPTQAKVYVTIADGDQQVYAETLPLSQLGSFAGTFKLGDDVALGSYDISVRNQPTDDPFATLSFRVADYHKPEFQVTASASTPNVLAGDKLNLKLGAGYYSGGSVPNATVDWFLESVPFYFQPSSKYGQFNFSDWDRDSYWSPPSSGGNSLAQGKGVTDADGNFSLDQLARLGDSKLSQQVTFNANVTDIAGNVVSGQATTIVHQTPVYAGIRSKDYVGTKGKPQSFDLVALDWASKPVPNQALTVTFVERRWYSVQQQDAQGQLSWVSSVKDIPVGSSTQVQTDNDGLATVSFTPPAGGVYKATVSVRDTKGHSQQASTYLWVASDDYIAWRQTNDRSFSLIADKSSYAPGDTAQIMIAQPFQGDVYALVTYERGHIYKQEVLLLHGNSTIYQLPVTKDMAPMAFVSVVVVSGADATKSPDFKVGMTRINVDTSQQTLDVSVSTDKVAAGPGDEVTYTVQTKDAQGKPTPAEISLAVVDKAVLALAPSNSSSILSAFYPEQGLSVMTSVGIVLSAEDFNANYKESVTDGESSGSGGGGGKGQGDLGIITVRQDFKDTAYFTAQVTTDADGKAQVKVKLPENLTTWQVDVRAATADSRVGQITSELISTKPLFVEVQTPRFFINGDAARVGATVHNNSGNAMSVKVSLDVQGADLKTPSEQTVDVPANRQAYVTWDLVVQKGVQRVDLTAHATSASFSDSSKPALGTLSGQGLPVYSYNVPETVGTSGLLGNENSQTEAFQLPKNLSVEDATLSVEISPSLAASMKDGLTYLEDYPYLCIEQTVSRFLPNVIAARALKLAGQPSLTLQDKLDAQVNPALQRIYAKQNSDGGWSWWDGQNSDPQTSAYVVLGLLEARDAGYPVSSDVLARAVEFLKGLTESGAEAPNDGIPPKDSPVALRSGGPQPGTFALQANDPSWKFNRQAFILYVLARGGEQPSTGFIYDHRVSLDLYGKAYLAQAIALADPTDKRIPALMSDLSSATVMSAAGAHWEEKAVDYWNWNTDVRTTAIVLNAYIQIDPKNPVTANAVRWLMDQRSGGGHWSSTQETAWTLMALTNWLVSSQEFDTQYAYAVGLNGSMLQQGAATKDNLTQPVDIKVGLKDLLADQVNYLVITRGQGTGNLYYSAYMSVALPVESVKPLDQGVSISRQYFALAAPKTAITQANRGDLVRVRLTIVVPDAVHYLVVDDPLPAGLEALDASLATDTQVPQSYTRQDYDARGWGWWYFSHIELRDQKVVLSADYLPAGTYVYTYLTRASTIGTFKVIPPTAAEFYFPDVAGRGAGSTFTVK